MDQAPAPVAELLRGKRIAVAGVSRAPGQAADAVCPTLRDAHPTTRGADMASDWTWDVLLDALAAAPAQHRLIFENAHVRVLDTQISPGERTPVHTHRWPAAHYVLSWSDFVRRDANGTVLLDTRTAGPRVAPEALWGDPLPPHSLENVGAAPLRIISTEVKSPPPGAHRSP